MTATEAVVAHDWRLVAPWWHWPTVAQVSKGKAPVTRGRQTGPAFQKYDTPDLVNTFLADPQLRLQFQSASDETATVVVGSGKLAIPVRTSTGRRKLYLGSHHRQYLVAVLPALRGGRLPRVDRTSVCQAGFVVRRRAIGPTPLKAPLELKRYGVLRRRRAAAEAQLVHATAGGPVPVVRLAKLRGRVEALAAQEDQAREAVRDWAQRTGVERQLQGWVPRGVDADGDTVARPPCGGGSAATPLAGVGEWEPVEELPEHLTEAWFPLYPLIPDPSATEHDATGETIWFGTVPTGSSDLTPGGLSRFDDSSLYEIRCFVRRHRPECAEDGSHCSCPITWSDPTEPYHLANQWDLEGTANRPVTVQLPDLDQVRADALRLGPGGSGGVKFQSAEALTFDVEDGEGANPGLVDFQICSFAIPLITIVAKFLLELVLPIVVFLFQLWFLLLLKFCIPPKLTIDGDLSAALEAVPPSIELSASVEARFAVGGDLRAGLEGLLKDATATYKDAGGSTPGDRILADADSTRELVAVGRGLRPVDAAPEPPDRVYAPRVARDEVVPA